MIIFFIIIIKHTISKQIVDNNRLNHETALLDKLNSHNLLSNIQVRNSRVSNPS